MDHAPVPFLDRCCLVARRDGQDPEAQAAELLEEIRRRSGERDRSESERDYLKRLLDLF